MVSGSNEILLINSSKFFLRFKLFIIIIVFSVIPLQGAKAWVADYKHPHYQAGAAAIKTVFGVEPDFTREGNFVLFLVISIVYPFFN